MSASPLTLDKQDKQTETRQTTKATDWSYSQFCDSPGIENHTQTCEYSARTTVLSLQMAPQIKVIRPGALSSASFPGVPPDSQRGSIPPIPPLLPAFSHRCGLFLLLPPHTCPSGFRETIISVIWGFSLGLKVFLDYQSLGILGFR